jgi:hypothetical protein
VAVDLQLPIASALAGARSVLLAGAGGGADVFGALPLYFALERAGIQPHLASLSFASIQDSNARELAPGLVRVTSATESELTYFPELALSRWFAKREHDVPVYAFARLGVRPLAAAYEHLVRALNVDAVILVDGGTDSLLRGDEAGLGTPEDDAASLAAIAALSGIAKYLVCVGFGIDAYHGVSHAHVLEAIAGLTRTGDFLGAWSLLPTMPDVVEYQAAVEYAFRPPTRPSIIHSSILSAIRGEFGDYHATARTEHSKLFINPLMGLYWAFRLDGVVRRHLYLDAIRETDTYSELQAALERFRNALPAVRPSAALPL